MPDGLGPALGILFLLVVWSSVISVMVGRLDWREAVPGASAWRVWGPAILAWSWPLPIAGFVVSVFVDAVWGTWILLLVPLALLAATVLVVLEFRRRRAEDRAAETPRRVKV